MPGLLLPLALSLAFASQGDVASAAPEDPRVVVREAARSVEEDSAARARARWEARLERDSTDRAAILGLATLARLTYDYPRAALLYGRLSPLNATVPDGYAVYALLGLGQGLEEQGQDSDAAAQLDRALTLARAVGDGTAEAEALSELAFPRARSKGVPAGLALLDTADRLLPPSAFDLRSWLALRRAFFLGMMGSPDAVAEANASVELARRAGDLRAEAHAVRAVGKVLWFRGQSDSALDTFRQAEGLYRRAHDHSGLATLLTDQASALLARGELGRVKELMRQVLAEAEASHSPYAVGTAHVGFAAVDMYLKDFVTAAQHLNKALSISEAQGSPNQTMKVRQFLTFVAVGEGDFVAAKRQVLAVLDYYRGMGEIQELFHMYRKLAAVAMHERDWATAERALADAHALASKVGDAQLEYDEGRLALVRGDLDAAERRFVERLRTLESAQHLHRYDIRLRLAHIYARRGELARAEREATSAWDELDRWRETLGDRELRLLAFQVSPSPLEVASPAELTERDASIASLLGALAAGGHGDVAFELAERRRARELVDQLVRGEALRQPDGSSPPATGTEVWQRARHLTAADATAALPDAGTALLEFVTAGEGAPTTLFVVQRAGVRARVLPPIDSLGQRVGRFVALVESGSDPGELARALGAALLDLALADLEAGVTRLILVPDGALHRVPWDALRLSDGRHVVERYAVSVAPSTAVAAALWGRTRRDAARGTGPLRLLAFGDPAFASEGVTPAGGASQDASAETYRSAFDSAGGLPRLRASAREARSVARYAPAAEVRLRERASAAFLKHTSLDSFRIIHFATHALVDERTVARTALALAPGGGESGFVGPGDLAALRLDADLVVLSACKTARGLVIEGEGVQGLTAPFLQAGARSVVATQWRIGDRNTVSFVTAFYDALARGLPVADALRAAKLEAIRRGALASEWAAFIAVGDPLVTIPLRVPPPVERWWVAGALVFALGSAAYSAYFLRTRRRRMAKTR